jgi:hypothetical protein
MTCRWSRRVCLVVALAVGFLAAGEAALQNGLTVGSEDDREGADILGAFTDSQKLLLLEHGARVAFQVKTRRELGGNFFADYRRSVHGPGQWNDTDAWWVNYVGHPIHGAVAGYIRIDHEPASPSELRFTPRYWASRTRAMAWSACCLRFEIGPFSEASIGNVGMRPEITGWVDHVIMPVGGWPHRRRGCPGPLSREAGGGPHQEPDSADHRPVCRQPRPHDGEHREWARAVAP